MICKAGGPKSTMIDTSWLLFNGGNHSIQTVFYVIFTSARALSEIHATLSKVEGVACDNIAECDIALQ